MQATQLTLGDYAIMADLMPAWDYFTQQEFLNDHVLTFKFHYYDCNCFECYAAHYPCGDITCDYCDSVKRLLAEGYTREKATGCIIDYATYIASGFQGTFNGDCSFDTNYDTPDMIWRTCPYGDCDMLIDGLTADKYDGFCSEACYEASQESEENNLPECAWCDAKMHENDGNGILCDSCLENSEHGYEVSLDDTEYYDELWIGPDGTYYAVSSDSGGHASACQVMGYASVDECERAGYVHLTDCYGHSWEYIPSNPSQALIDAVIDLCELKEWDIPEEIAEYMQKSDQDMTCNDLDTSFEAIMDRVKMQDLSIAWLTAPRTIRDQFYKLSGD